MVVDPEELLERDLLTGFSPRSFCNSFYTTQRPLFSVGTCVWNPPADVYETEEELVVKIEVPGIDPNDMTISFENSALIVRGFRRDSEQHAQTRLHHVEIRYGQFERAFSLPLNLDTDAIRADYENGFLIIRAPKRFQPPRTIQVESE